MLSYPYKVKLSFVNSDGVIFKTTSFDVSSSKGLPFVSKHVTDAFNYCSGVGYTFLVEFIRPQSLPLSFMDGFQVLD